MQQVSVASNALDLYSPKFELDNLGKAEERIIIKVLVSGDSKSINLFGTYAVGSRHAQISSNILGAFGGIVTVLSVSRYGIQDAISEINSRSQTRPWNLNLALAGNNLLAEIESRKFPLTLKRMYTIGGRLYLLVQLLGKRLKISMGNDEITLYDSSNREIVGLTTVGNRLTIKRKFQHLELVAKP